VLFHNLFAKIEITLSSANLSQTLANIQKRGFTIFDISWIDEYSVRFTVRKREQKKLESILKNRGDKIHIRQLATPASGVFGLVKRPFFIGLILLLFFMTLWLPSRVLFISVEGADTIPEQRIIEEINQAGIRFMSSRRAIRSESVKNDLLENLPQLQWVGINTYGCRAIIKVRERSQIAIQQETHQISSIVAARDGVVRNILVERGTAQCQVGQVVRKGQLLVSGYTDCGIYLQGTRAKAEIFADTVRKVSINLPCEYTVRSDCTDVRKKYSVIIGKNRINLYKGSGISGVTCAKIYEEKYITLPGGFVLPLGIGVEKIYDYQTEPQIISYDQQVLSEIASSYMKREIQSGRIISSDVLFECNETNCSLTEIFYCYEMIGMTYIEERVPENE
jgi:similar to stage IV sporulation protein